MKRSSLFVAVVFSALVLGAGSFTPEEAKFVQLMKGAKAATNGVKQGLADQNAKAVEADARKVATLFGDMARWWDAKKLGQPARWSRESAQAITGAAEAARRGDLKQAGERFDAYMKSCRECHSTHREKAGDEYRFKY